MIVLVVVSKSLLFSPLREMTKFDKHIFQMACNHQLVVLWLVNLPPSSVAPREIRFYEGLINHWFPFVRPAIKQV